MGLFAEHLNLKDFRVRTAIAYYRDMRLIHDYFGKNPKYLTQKQIRAYILYDKEDKQWAAQTVCKAIAAARMFYGDMLGKPWKLWDVVKVRDRETLWQPTKKAAWVNQQTSHTTKFLQTGDFSIDRLIDAYRQNKLKSTAVEVFPTRRIQKRIVRQNHTLLTSIRLLRPT